jgi:predicted metal-dependent peptidase
MFNFGTLTARQKLTKSRVLLNKLQPFFGYLTMRLNFIEDNESEPKTMAVDKNGNLYYNTDFVDKLTIDELNGVLCHEVMHCALLHLERIETKDRMLWNVSTDAVINSLILKNDLTLPKDTIRPNYNGIISLFGVELIDVHKKSANEVYDALYNNYKKNTKSIPIFDGHIYTDTQNNNNGKDKSKNKSNKKENIDWEKELVEASTFAKLQGSMPSGLDRFVNEVLGNTMDWRSLLYKYITSAIPYDYSWSRPNKRSYATGIYMPSVLKEGIDIVVSLDTSGSISNKEYQTFLGELLGITNSFSSINLKVIFNDTQVYGPFEFLNPTQDDIIKMKPLGGGGTDHIPVFEWVNKEASNAQLIICFTDGYTSYPKDSPIDCIWVLAGSHYNKNNIPFGSVVELPREL